MLETVPTNRSKTVLIPASPRPRKKGGGNSIVETIFRGVTEEIFGAFQRTHPGMFPREFESFVHNVRQGLGYGVGDAKEELILAGQFEGELIHTFQASSTELFERLESWFETTRRRLFG